MPSTNHAAGQVQQATKESPAAPFPQPVVINGRNYNWRSGLEAYKCALAGKNYDAPAGFVDELVPATQAAKELGIGRRTYGRRIASAGGEQAKVVMGAI